MRIDELAPYIKNLLDKSPELSLIGVQDNNYTADPVGEGVSAKLADTGLAVCVWTFGGAMKGASPHVSATVSVIENPVQRQAHINSLQPTPQSGSDWRALRVVSEILKEVYNSSAPRCGRAAIGFAPTAFERVVSEAGRVHFDVRLMVPVTLN